MQKSFDYKSIAAHLTITAYALSNPKESDCHSFCATINLRKVLFNVFTVIPIKESMHPILLDVSIEFVSDAFY